MASNGGSGAITWRTGLDLSHSSFRRSVCEHVLGTRTAISRQRPAVIAQTHVDEVGVEYLDQLLDLTGADYMGLESLDLREVEIEIDRCFLGTHLESATSAGRSRSSRRFALAARLTTRTVPGFRGARPTTATDLATRHLRGQPESERGAPARCRATP